MSDTTENEKSILFKYSYCHWKMENGKHTHGRPRKWWMECIKEDLKSKI